MDVYSEEFYTVETKPEVGEELNKPAIITLWGMYPNPKRVVNLSPEEAVSNFEAKLIKQYGKTNITFIHYDPQIGEWKFKVDHFSKYGLDSDTDDEEEQLINQLPTTPSIVQLKN